MKAFRKMKLVEITSEEDREEEKCVKKNKSLTKNESFLRNLISNMSKVLKSKKRNNQEKIVLHNQMLKRLIQIKNEAKEENDSSKLKEVEKVVGVIQKKFENLKVSRKLEMKK